MKPTVTAIAPWFGSDRMVAERFADPLKGCRWCGIPFGGGMSIVPYLDAPSIVVGDLHRHIINLARTLADWRLGPALYRRLRRIPFCEDMLDVAQERAKAWDGLGDKDWLKMSDWDKLAAAESYFIAVWMGRSGNAGTDKEFTGNLSVRWNANGGDSNTRYRSAVASLVAWRRALQRCNFVVEDCFDFLAKCKDTKGHGIYADPPFPGPGDRYRHTFSEADHRKLASVLACYREAVVVCRFYDHPLVRSLYPEHYWTWTPLVGRKQSNADAPEVMLTNHQSRQAELFGA